MSNMFLVILKDIEVYREVTCNQSVYLTLIIKEINELQMKLFRFLLRMSLIYHKIIIGRKRKMNFKKY
jgi:hypothetical protein